MQAALGSASNLDLRLRVSIRVTQDGNGGDFDECAALFDLLVREFGNSRPGRAEALNAHAVLLALWFLRHDANTGPGQQQPAVRDTLVQRFRLLLEQNYRDARPVHFYAEALGITSDHLSRTCRASTGSGALDLMRDRVVLEARRLLAYTPETIAGIARELGFEDPGHFSRFFANAVGQPPSIYRRAVFSGFAGAPAVSKSH